MNTTRFTIYEHDSLDEGRTYDGIVFSADHRRQLTQLFREKNFPYYTLTAKGARFCEWVGVLQTGQLVIEVLPKADRTHDKTYWRNMLLDMLRATGIIRVHAPTSSLLHFRPHSLLDLYIHLFLEETDYLLHKGLIKTYHRVEGNRFALKGAIHFSRHLTQNMIHQERFYTRHTVYDQQHPFNQVLYMTLLLIDRINTNGALTSRIGHALLHFPELPPIRIDEPWFDAIRYSRKTEQYSTALSIARLILLNYHPDVKAGKNDLLAIMFDMNKVWEKFIHKSLARYYPQFAVSAQSRKYFWSASRHAVVSMIPDIVISASDKTVILDTKWKNIGLALPSPEDLRQLYVYSRYHSNAQTALVYPGDQYNCQTGNYRSETDHVKTSGQTCAVITIPVESPVHVWQKNLADHIISSFNIKVSK